MERFLSVSAKYIYEKHSDALHDVCVVFPNRRAGVFFTSYLQKEIQGSVLAPEITTVGELISGFSTLFSSERLQLLTILYNVFRKHTGTKETFDEFYFWGEILLSDFNDIDRYLVDARDIFTNVSDIKEIESVFDYLSENQKKALEQFWGSLAVKDKKEFQQKHTVIWEKLYPIYAEFKQILTEQELAYAGMIDRDVVEHWDLGAELPFQTYYIIGLNALNACEEKFFSFLQKGNKARFLWDYDDAYLLDKKNEAGRFLRRNLKMFPSPEDFIFNTKAFNTEKKIDLVAVSSSYGQAQQIPVFVEDIKENFKKEFDNTAIVLADESLLFSALGAIPNPVGKVNVTMGYPVKNSMIFGFLSLLINLLKNRKKNKDRGDSVYHRYVTDVLNHQLMGYWETEDGKTFLNQIRLKNRISVALDEIRFSEFHSVLFDLPELVIDYSSYFIKVLGGIYERLKQAESENTMLLEIIYSIYQAIEKLDEVIRKVIVEQKQEIAEVVYFRLFSQYLGKVSVAFEGEPLSGIQVMGILETRCLDFDNLIILGLNENKWPRTFTAPSFLPYNIRKGFGLPGIDEQDAMYAYYFYRLFQRAKNITATYSVVKEGISTGELSRYGYQLKYDSVHTPQAYNLEFNFSKSPEKVIEISSSKEIVDKLLERNSPDRPLSPSAINTYLNCSLKFYFRYVMGLPEPDEIKEEIDGVTFGNIFHDTMETLYQPFVGKNVEKADVEGIIKNKIHIVNEITRQISIHYFKQEPRAGKAIKLEGKTLLIFENIQTYLTQLLRVDKQLAPFKLVSLEEKYQGALSLNSQNKSRQIHIGGKIDRVDQTEGKIRVLDYKTGNVKSFSFSAVEELFQRDEKEHKKEILQALIYTWALEDGSDTVSVQPAIYSLRKLFDENHSPLIKWTKNDFTFKSLKQEFETNLEELVNEIYSVDNKFVQTVHADKCTYCAYRKICQRY